jgi:hypothetical protein
MVFTAMVSGGPGYRELRAIFREIRHAAHRVKELGEELLDEDDEH